VRHSPPGAPSTLSLPPLSLPPSSALSPSSSHLPVDVDSTSRSDEDEPGSGEEELGSSSVHVAVADPVRMSLDWALLMWWQQIY